MGLFRRKRKSLESTEGNFNTNNINYDVINNIANKSEIDRQAQQVQAIANTNSQIQSNKTNTYKALELNSQDYNNSLDYELDKINKAEQEQERIRQERIRQERIRRERERQEEIRREQERERKNDNSNQSDTSNTDNNHNPRRTFKLPNNATNVYKDEKGRIKSYITRQGNRRIKHLVGDINDRGKREYDALIENQAYSNIRKLKKSIPRTITPLYQRYLR